MLKILEKPFGLAELMMGTMIEPDFSRAFLDKAPLILVPFAATLGLTGQVVGLNSPYRDEYGSVDAGRLHVHGGTSGTSWSCYPGHYSHLVVGLTRTPTYVGILTLGWDMFDPTTSRSRISESPYIEPLGYGMWGDDFESVPDLENIHKLSVPMIGRGKIEGIVEHLHHTHEGVVLERLHDLFPEGIPGGEE